MRTLLVLGTMKVKLFKYATGNVSPKEPSVEPPAPWRPPRQVGCSQPQRGWETAPPGGRWPQRSRCWFPGVQGGGRCCWPTGSPPLKLIVIEWQKNTISKVAVKVHNCSKVEPSNWAQRPKVDRQMRVATNGVQKCTVSKVVFLSPKLELPSFTTLSKIPTVEWCDITSPWLWWRFKKNNQKARKCYIISSLSPLDGVIGWFGSQKWKGLKIVVLLGVSDVEIW